ncbi:MAG: 4-alpha-glucanotransferase [Clostridia bacterium]|nr:4-alpha-glucanotransferase [Clostridia bacterium]
MVQMKRASGVLMHVSTLFGDYSIGSLGKNAKKFIDFLSECGFSYWQTLPFCMPDGYNSPYKSFSAFSVNPFFIDLELLFEKGYITNAELSGARQNTPYSCEYERLGKERLDLLKVASKKAPRKEIKDFIKENPHIGSFCRFMALKSANGGKEWQKWTVKEYDDDELFMWEFTQYEFISQWLDIKKYANEHGVKIIGDLPMFVDADSSDVYFDRKSFMLDAKGYPSSVAGVPPDYFSEDGQVWGNPHYNWDVMEKDGFSWWRDRLTHTLTLFDGVRIDHFRGLESFYSIPYGAKNAKKGKWVKAKGREMIDAVRDITECKLIIAEDLGAITPEVEALVKHSTYLSMKVMQFGFLSEEDCDHRPHNYINGCVAYTGTHDNNTLLGYVWELPERDRKMLFNYCGYEGDLHGKYEDNIFRTLFASAAGLTILPIQDLLMFGNNTRMNIPGKSDGNWAFRITEENLRSIDREKFKKLNKLYGR